MSLSVSGIVMAYNEAPSLTSVVREIDTVLSGMILTYEIIIIDDGSNDGTGRIADTLLQEFPKARVVHHAVNRGLGGVYKTGFQAAQGDFITFFPADGQFPAAIIERFVPLMDDADMVLGYLPKRTRSFLATFLSGAEKLLFRVFFGRIPKFQGIMMFKRTLLEKFSLVSTGRGWTVVLELIIRVYRAGYKVVSVPTELRARAAGKSKVNTITNIAANIYQAIDLRLHF